MTDPVEPGDRPRTPKSGLPLGGLVKGMTTTLSTMLHRAHTAQYPDVSPDLAPRSRGTIALFEENCTVCMLCARECPDWCIYIESHKETIPATTEGGRDRSRNVLDRFAIDFSLCMYCGICVEVCPFDALFWSPEFEYSEADITDMTHEKDRLREWMWTVPPPPAHEANAEPDKVVTAAVRTPPPPVVDLDSARSESTSSTNDQGSGGPPVVERSRDQGEVVATSSTNEGGKPVEAQPGDVADSGGETT